MTKGGEGFDDTILKLAENVAEEDGPGEIIDGVWKCWLTENDEEEVWKCRLTENGEEEVWKCWLTEGEVGAE